MANETTNIKLRKPVPTENFDIDRDFNANWDKIDEEFGNLEAGMASKADLTEIEVARGIEASLGARLDSTDADYEALAQDYSQHKLDYVEQRSQDQLKVAKVEKDINDYKSTLANVNANQEAKQSATGYGVVSLPKNSVSGQVSVSVKGETYTNLIKNGNIKPTFTTTGYSELGLMPNGSIFNNGIYSSERQPIDVKSGSKYFAVVELESDTVGDLQDRLILRYSDGSFESFGTTAVGFKRVAKILSPTKTLKANLKVREGNLGLTKFKSISVIDLTAHGLDTLTLEQCEQRFPNYFNDTKSTISANRLKSVGKNLEKNDTLIFNKRKVVFGDIIKVEPNKIVYIKQTVDVPFRVAIILFDSAMNQIKTGTPISDNMYYSGSYDAWISPSDVMPRTLGYKIYANPNIQYIQVGAFPTSGTYAKISYRFISQVDSDYEPYTESTQYLPNVGELRSLPNGVKDEIRVSGGKAEHIQRVKKYVLQESDIQQVITALSNIDFVLITLPIDISSSPIGDVVSIPAISKGWSNTNTMDNVENIGKWGGNSTTTRTIGVALSKGTTLVQAKTALAGTEITYQLAEPIITPIEVSGTLLSNPSGTVYVENIVADAGTYTTKFDIKELQLPIKSVDKLIKYNFETGVQTVLDTSLAVINADKKSFTHPDLTKDDMVFVDYFHDVESTLGETTIEYLDSRHTIKDSVNNKFYKWDIKSANGVPTVSLTEVL